MDGLREAFEEAYDEAEENQTEEDQKNPTDAVAEEPREEELDDTSEDKKAEQADEEADEEASDESKPDQETEVPDNEKAVKNSKAPHSWSPKAREAWGKMPAEAQAQVEKREREINKTLNDSAQARGFAKQLNDTLTPYREGLLAAGYQDPLQAVNTFLATEAQLRGGTAQDKAYTVAQLIKNYGVDIGTLDNMLAGEPPQQQQGYDPGIEQMLEQRLAPMNQYLQQQEYNQQQAYYAEQHNANTQVETFKQGHEFLEDVRNDMANLMDGAASRGESMDLERAYSLACQIHPEVSKVMSTRSNEQKIMGTRQNVAAKKAAAISVKGNQSGQINDGGANISLRDQIAEAWNDQAG
jgi:hypothetical protein